MEKKTVEEFKTILYKNYRSTHNAHLYGSLSLASIVRNFPVWNYYYRHHLPLNKKASILEIGCGDGGFVYFLQQMGYTQVTGIDLSAEQVDLGKHLGISNLNVADVHTFLQGQVKYDLIVARDVIEHFTRQQSFELLTKISNVLNAGGKFIMQVPNGQGIFYTSIYYGDYTHEMAYTVSSVSQLFLNTGFKNIHCYPTGPVPYSWRGLVRKILWTLKVFQHRFWKAIETGKSAGIFTSNLIAVGEKE